ncbi:E3 ubiquitin/ISG15 ligase TRIM25-like [Mixophyes fleayi]|uniref:E3 ubiquitin/ISG15 ligase TRIM25-like n=1 Tax=Mixophyes fleayi TaxID=3061075 RepID=UPI003F4DC1A3
MAAADLRNELKCNICLNIYTDPVTLRCGHNFCRVCIDRVLDSQEGSGVYSCPDCKEQVQKRPALYRNITLHNIVEPYLSTEPEQEETGILCTYCIHSPVPAVKSCLLCEAFLCDNHLRAHNKSAEHVITEPNNSMLTRKCSVHMKILEYYCTEDAACICVTCCLAGEHVGHKVEQLHEASNKKKETLKNVFKKLLSKRAETEERLLSLQERTSKVQENAAGERERVTALFRDLRRQLEDLEKRVLSEISRQEDKVSLSVSDLIQELHVQKDELSRKMRHILELFNVTDPVTFLQEPDRGDLCDTEEGDNIDRQTYDKKVHDIGDLDKDLTSVILHTGLADIVSGVKGAIILQEGSDMILDVNTAGNKLNVSDDFKTIAWVQQSNIVPETPQIFQVYPQVLSTRRLSSGRHFLEWKVTYIDYGSLNVGMCYPTIDRKGDQSCLGFNNKSWCLRRYRKQYTVIHDSNIICLPHNPSCDKFRLYLDYEAGQLSFYELCDPIRHLHTFTATFTEPLHAAFYIFGSHIKLKITNSDTVQCSA